MSILMNIIENVCFRLQNSRIILYSAANKVKFIKIFRRAYSFLQCILTFSELISSDENCENLTYKYFDYWLVLCAIMIWIPTAIMFFAYTLIWFKLRKASKAFPYLSNQSRIARSRQKVIHMLFMLIIIELICWGPWQFWILCEYIIHKYYSSNVPGVRFNLFNVLNSNILSSM